MILSKVCAPLSTGSQDGPVVIQDGVAVGAVQRYGMVGAAQVVPGCQIRPTGVPAWMPGTWGLPGFWDLGAISGHSGSHSGVILVQYGPNSSLFVPMLPNITLFGPLFTTFYPIFRPPRMTPFETQIEPISSRFEGLPASFSLFQNSPRAYQESLRKVLFCCF